MPKNEATDAGEDDDEEKTVTITGDVEGVNAAKMEIEAIIRERRSNHRASLEIERSFHPFICGPDNVTIQAIMTETGVKIHVPPSLYPGAVEKEKFDKDGNVKNMNAFIIIGDKDAVEIASGKITSVYEEVVCDENCLIV